MDTFKSFEKYLPEVNAATFDEIALGLFALQAHENTVYRNYLQALKIQAGSVRELHQIPFLPIRFFKTQLIKTGHWQEERIFKSSGTTATHASQHAVFSTKTYLMQAQRIFEHQFGALQNLHLLALLPSYLEQGNSSLVSMIQHFIEQTKSAYSGFYLHNHDQLLADVEHLQAKGEKVVVWGVTYALLELADRYTPDWNNVLLLETGGMKGRRKEITREALHALLKEKLKVPVVHSEYGMTELFSQAYTKGANVFTPGNTMRIIIRDVTDPFQKGLVGQMGGINVIDLANYSTMAFIETEDLGKLHKNNTFEVLGRLDNSDLRGCNLLVE